MPLSLLMLLSLCVNLPLGYLRSGCRKLSWPWFAYIHLSIPLIATCRLLSDIRFAAVPLLVLAGLAGQLLGARVRAS
jgi:hypothetical protein